MYRAISFLTVFIMSFTLLISCGKDNVTLQFKEKGFGYFPLQQQNPKIYKYTNITIDVVAGIQDTSIWYIRETIADTVIDTLDYSVIRVVREKRRADTLSWEPATVLSIRTYDRQIVRVDENIPYLILSFPIKHDYSWNGNKYNTNDEELYTYSSENIQDTILNMKYDSVLVVSQNYFKSIYTYVFKEERYAYGIGMISKIVYDVESQPNHANINLSLPIEERITKGTITIYELMP